MTAVRTPFVDEMHRRPPDAVSSGGSRTWCVRGRNFAVAVTDLVAGDTLIEGPVVDEYVLIVADDVPVTVTDASGGSVRVSEPALVVIPPGPSTVQAVESTVVVRVFASHSRESMRLAVNDGSHDDPAVAPLGTAAVGGSGELRVHRMSEVGEDPGRLGRIFRTNSLMVNWFPTKIGARDTEALSPHSHDDFEQMSVTLAGAFIHHFRTPWTPRMSEWRDDEHVAVGSPSMVLIPANVIHTTRWVGEGEHVLIDVFSPPRADFLERGWVLNADDYLSAGSVT